MSDNQASHKPADPAVAAVSLFTVVVLLLGLQFTHAIPASSQLAFAPILLMAGLTQIVMGTIAVQHGDHVLGLFFCTFGPFLISFAALSTGIVHAWWPIPVADLPHVEAAFLMGWTAVLSLWLLLSVVLPVFFTTLLALINAALWALIDGLWNANPTMDKTAGWLLLLTAVGGAYFIASRWLSWAGRDVLSLGRPLVRDRARPTQVRAAVAS